MSVPTGTPFFKVYTDSELKEKLKYYSKLYGTNQSQVINILVSGWVDEIEKATPIKDAFGMAKKRGHQSRLKPSDKNYREEGKGVCGDLYNKFIQ